VNDMRYTTLVVTVGDHATTETRAEIRDQVATAVRGAGFVSVDVVVAETAGA
jgi:hypothetical protein